MTKIIYLLQLKDHPQSSAMMPFSRSKELLSSSIRTGKRLTPIDEPREIYELWLNCPTAEIRPGDTIGIFPRNCDDLVQRIIDQQEWSTTADIPFKIELLPGAKKKTTMTFIPNSGSTIRQVLTECIDLTSRPPSKLFLLALLKYCPDEDTKRTLQFLCSKEGTSLYTQEIMEKRVSVAKLLLEGNVKIPFTVLLEHGTRLLPRPYSIVSSTTKTPDKIRLTFSWDPLLNGTTTSMLKKYIDNDMDQSVAFYLRTPTKFRFEVEDASRNLIIMIAPGLGVITYLGMLEELEKYNKESSKRLLFTSWRNAGKDDVFLSEFQSLLNNESINYSYTRDGSENKVYVQDLIHSKKEEISLLLKNNPDFKIYICGEGKVMIPQIVQAIGKCLPTPELLQELQTGNQIVTEQWF